MYQLHAFSTPNSIKPVIALEELGLDYGLHAVNVHLGEQKSPQFAELNPNAKVPVLTVSEDGRTMALTESAAILVYLAERHGALLPATAEARARVFEQLFFHASAISPAFGQAGYFQKLAPEVLPQAIERFHGEALRTLALLDGALARHEFVAGTTYSIADIAHFGWIWRRAFAGVDLDSSPHVARWFQAMSQRPAVQRAIARVEALVPAAAGAPRPAPYVLPPPPQPPTGEHSMTLQAKLDAFKADFKGGKAPYFAPPEIHPVMERATAELVASGQAGRALKAGDRAPAFILNDPEGKPVSSAELLAKGPLVISFYRGVWCPYCNLELQALQETLPQFQALGAHLLAISPQTAANSRKSQRQNKLDFPILSDTHGDVAEAFGLRFALPDYLIELYKQLKNDLPAFNDDPAWSLPMPARYVIGQDGIIAYAEVNPDYTRRPEPDSMLPVLQGLPASA